jgi:hypothetical protein
VKYFYDTEFIENGSTVDLISIGIVAEDGREYYAISTQFDPANAGVWVKENVLNKLPGAENGLWKPRSQIASEVRDFILGDPTNDALPYVELWAYYGSYDHVALCQLYGTMMDLPEGMPMYTRELMQLWENAGRPERPALAYEHDALADARWNKALWNVCVDRFLPDEAVAAAECPPGCSVCTGREEPTLASNADEPDEATVERVAAAMYQRFHAQYGSVEPVPWGKDVCVTEFWYDITRAALATYRGGAV